MLVATRELATVPMSSSLPFSDVRARVRVTVRVRARVRVRIRVRVRARIDAFGPLRLLWSK